ncbi:MAG TPA: hypothetical protein VII50_03750 [Acidothermaceae bacterium]
MVAPRVAGMLGGMSWESGPAADSRPVGPKCFSCTNTMHKVADQVHTPFAYRFFTSGTSPGRQSPTPGCVPSLASSS